MIGLDYKVHTSGNLDRSIAETARLLDSNVSVGLNVALNAAKKIIQEPIPAGPSGIRKAVDLDKARVSTLLASVSTEHPLARVVEEKTDPHEIRPRNSVSDMVAGTAHKALRFKVKGKVVFAKKVNHPGTPGKYSWKAADDYVERHLPAHIKMAVDATIDGRKVSLIDAAILGALQSLL